MAWYISTEFRDSVILDKVILSAGFEAKILVESAYVQDLGCLTILRSGIFRDALLLLYLG